MGGSLSKMKNLKKLFFYLILSYIFLIVIPTAALPKSFNKIIFITAFLIITIIFGSLFIILLKKLECFINLQESQPKDSSHTFEQSDSINGETAKGPILDNQPQTDIRQDNAQNIFSEENFDGIITEVEGISSDVFKTATDIENIAENSFGVLEFVKEVQDMGLNTLESTINGKEVVENMVDGIHKTSEVSGGLEQTINHLNESSNVIGDIVERITGMAKQIHLLALNAAIEAAKGGDSKGGFSVIASEMAKLATQSEISVKEISGILANIQVEIHKSFELMNIQQSYMDTSVEKGGVIIEVINKVTAETENISGKIKEVVDLVERQMGTIGEVAIGIASTANTMDKLCTEIKELKKQTRDITKV